VAKSRGTSGEALAVAENDTAPPPLVVVTVSGTFDDYFKNNL
jgi:hypothetical protein